MDLTIKSFLVFSMLAIFLVGFASAAVSIPSANAKTAFAESKIGKDLVDKYSSVPADFKVDVFITLRTFNGKVPSDLSIVNELRGKYPGRISQNAYMDDAAIIFLTKSELTNLLYDKRVISASLPVEGTISLEESVQIVNATGAWNQHIGSSQLDASGQTICVLDTGIDFSHPDLAAKNALGGTTQLDCYSGSVCVPTGSITDLNGHGTHVAGIAAASGGVDGIAKGANLISAKIFPGSNSSSAAYAFALRRAIDWCVANSLQYNISVISVSSGSSSLNSTTCDTWTAVMPATLVSNVTNAFLKNISVVASTGNDGSSTSISAPACLSKVIPVSSIKKDLSYYSGANYNSLVKLFAVGKDVASTCIDSQDPDQDGYCIKTGTSMAAPMVSGAIAITNQVLKAKNEKMTPKQIENLLYDTGVPVIGLPSGYALINVYGGLVALDTLAPTLEIISPSGGTSSNSNNVTLSYFASDEISGLAFCSYSLNGQPSQNVVCGQDVLLISTEGSNNITVTAVDGAGNSVQRTVTFGIDTTQPSLEITAPLDNSIFNNGQVDVVFSASDLGSGLASCSYNFNDNGEVPTACGETFVLSATEGTNTLSITATDLVGNEQVEAISFVLDTVNPEVEITSPVNGDYTSLLEVEIVSSTSDSGSGLAGCYYVLNEGEQNTVSCNQPFSVQAFDGTNVLTLYAQDLAGNEGSFEVSFMLDRSSPELHIMSPVEGYQTNDRSVNVNYEASDGDSGLQSCSYSLNSGSFVGIECNVPVNLEADEGSNQLVLMAVDNAGNQETAAVGFFVDTIAPVVTITSPVSQTYHSLSQMIEYSVDDGQASCSYTLNGGAPIVIICGEDVPFEAQEGENTVSVIAVDLLGNQDEDSVTFNVNLNPVLGDLNNDWIVDEADLAILLEQWGQCPAEGECPADFNGDGFVNSIDLKLLLYEYWTTYCTGDDINDPGCSKIENTAD